MPLRFVVHADFRSTTMTNWGRFLASQVELNWLIGMQVLDRHLGILVITYACNGTLCGLAIHSSEAIKMND